MIDQFGRNIVYARLSITDRCNLRCRYCMPEKVKFLPQKELLTYEEILRLCRLMVSLGITRFKVTGGEPLVRRGCVEFIEKLKNMPGVEQVTLTTNGLLLLNYLDALCSAGIDGINISLDTLNDSAYCALTGGPRGSVNLLFRTIEASVDRGLCVRLNCVLTEGYEEALHSLSGLAERYPLDVRFIELMPVGMGKIVENAGIEDALSILKRRFPDLTPSKDGRGNGPARYYSSGSLKGRIGVIGAVSHGFCSECNRVRLTPTGLLKPCLCYEEGTDLRALLRENVSDEGLREYMRRQIFQKPAAHCFDCQNKITEKRSMNRIGG